MGADNPTPGGGWTIVPPTAGSVLRSDFTLVRKGFDPDEVTAHLGRIAEQVAELESRIEGLQTELRRAQQLPAPPYDEAASRVAELIRTFDQDIARMRADAESEADRIVREARAEAERVVAESDKLQYEAETERSRILVEAQRQAENVIGELSSRRTALLEDIGTIRRALLDSVARLDPVLGVTEGDVTVLEDEPRT
jgi:vacuolar-type H+-ATPase subunit H